MKSYSKDVLKVFSIGIIFLLIALILSLIAMQTIIVRDSRTKVIELTNGINTPLFIIFGYENYMAYINGNLTFTSLCDNNINATLVLIGLKPNSSTILHVSLQPKKPRTVYVNNLHALLSVDKINCSLRLDLETRYTIYPYSFLSILSFALLVVGTAFIIIAIFGRALGKRAYYPVINS